eukprot:TRINITY_DN865_c3_g1_i3.p1 TRINITY_DN865_c3_g1~~TRINITY_DN865_c3_g1_i3.p1  ORF type:complete len:351 (+),score=58.67 TRINITY_DN865_c3_g1_i3:138-1190(+)
MDKILHITVKPKILFTITATTWLYYSYMTRLLGFEGYYNLFYEAYVTILYVAIIYTLYYISLIKTSTPPPNWEPSENQIDPINAQDDFKIRYCDLCKCYQPPRCYHCYKTNTCVLKKIIYSQWFGKCIGHSAHKSYLLYMTYVSNFYIILSLHYVKWLYIFLFYGVEDEYIECKGIICVVKVIGIIILIILTISFSMQVSLLHMRASVDVTPIEEVLQFKIYKERNRQMKYQNRKEKEETTPYEDEEHQKIMLSNYCITVFPYNDIADPLVPTKRVFGNNFLLWPIPTVPPFNEGLFFRIDTIWMNQYEDLLERRAEDGNSLSIIDNEDEPEEIEIIEGVDYNANISKND